MGSILSMAFTFLSGPILDKLIAPLTHIFDQYMNKVITEAQLREQIQALMLTTFKEIEVAHEQALTAMFQSFMGAVVQSPIMQRTWAFITISQGIMLLWFQIGIPVTVLIVRWYGYPEFKFPSSGNTADWSYALVGGCLGLGLAMKGTGIAGAIKGLIGK